VEASVAVEKGLLIEERRRRICDLVREHGRVTVEDLSKRFDTSVVTIRLDRTALEAAGALTRARGGALARREDDDLPIVIKQTLHHAEKIRIAKAAAALIKDGETIVLDSGTTNVSVIAKVDQLHILITDTAAREDVVEELRRRGVDVRWV